MNCLFARRQGAAPTAVPRVAPPRASTAAGLMLLCAAALLVSPGAWAADTLARIKETGKATIGARDASGGLSYAISPGVFGGFHVELCQRVLADVGKQLGLPKLAIEYRRVTSQNRVTLLQMGSVDMDCGSTTHTTARQRDAAFALTTFVEEVRVVVKADAGITQLGQLDGKRVATTTGSTSVNLLRQREKSDNLRFNAVYGKDHDDSFLLLQTGRADAFVMDSQIAAALIAKSKKPEAWRLLDEPLSVEPIAIMLPRDDPAFKKAVDDSLRTLMQSGEIARIYDKWFLQPIPPRKLRIGLPASAATRAAWAEPNDRPAESYKLR